MDTKELTRISFDALFYAYMEGFNNHQDTENMMINVLTDSIKGFMVERLKDAYDGGRSGWWDGNRFPVESLQYQLVSKFSEYQNCKDDEEPELLLDIINYAAMLYIRELVDDE